MMSHAIILDMGIWIFENGLNDSKCWISGKDSHFDKICGEFMFRYCDGPAMLFVECRSQQRKLKTKNCLNSWRCCIVECCRFGPDCKLARHPEITNTKSIIFGRGRRCYLPVLLSASSNAIYLFSARQSSATNSSKTENPNGFLHILFFFGTEKSKENETRFPFHRSYLGTWSAHNYFFSLFSNFDAFQHEHSWCWWWWSSDHTRCSLMILSIFLSFANG